MAARHLPDRWRHRWRARVAHGCLAVVRLVRHRRFLCGFGQQRWGNSPRS